MPMIALRSASSGRLTVTVALRLPPVRSRERRAARSSPPYPGAWYRATGSGFIADSSPGISGGPSGQDAVDGGLDLCPGVRARRTGHEQFVVVSVLVPDRCHHRQRNRSLVEGPAV